MNRKTVAAVLIICLLLITGAYALIDNQIIGFGENAEDVAAAHDSQGQQNQTDGKDQSTPGASGDVESASSSNAGEDTAGKTESGANEEDTTEKQNPEIEKPKLRFIAVGDIMLGRGVGYRLEKSGGYEKAFENVSSVLKQGDIVFGNLETPITASTHGLDSKRKIVLKAKPDSINALTSAGFNLISLSNNHMMDYYERGLFDTIYMLNQNNISCAGGGKNIDEARQPAIIEKNGLKIGLLAYTDMAELIFAGDPYLSFASTENKSGLVPRKYETIREDISKLREEVDLIAVSLHWGIEDSFKITDDQIEFAHNLIDDGADIILGHHPHQFQGMEIYKGKPIMYSMGNFLFDQNDPENMESFIIDMEYKGTELSQLTAIPVRIVDKSHVEIQTGEKATNILERQIELCRRLGGEPVSDDDMLVLK